MASSARRRRGRIGSRSRGSGARGSGSATVGSASGSGAGGRRRGGATAVGRARAKKVRRGRTWEGPRPSGWVPPAGHRDGLGVARRRAWRRSSRLADRWVGSRSVAPRRGRPRPWRAPLGRLAAARGAGSPGRRAPARQRDDRQRRRRPPGDREAAGTVAATRSGEVGRRRVHHGQRASRAATARRHSSQAGGVERDVAWQLVSAPSEPGSNVSWRSLTPSSDGDLGIRPDRPVRSRLRWRRPAR